MRRSFVALNVYCPLLKGVYQPAGYQSSKYSLSNIRTMTKSVLLVLLFIALGLLAAAQRTITGRITDDKGAGIARASVQVKNSNTGTTTADDGSFRLTVPSANSVLVISAVGTATQEITVGNQSPSTFHSSHRLINLCRR
jgi:hypothetical protein